LFSRIILAKHHQVTKKSSRSSSLHGLRVSVFSISGMIFWTISHTIHVWHEIVDDFWARDMYRCELSSKFATLRIVLFAFLKDVWIGNCQLTETKQRTPTSGRWCFYWMQWFMSAVLNMFVLPCPALEIERSAIGPSGHQLIRQTISTIEATRPRQPHHKWF